MKSRIAAVLFALSVAVVALLLGAGPALAKGGAASQTDVGSNISGWLSGLGRDLLVPISGLFGIGALFRRDIGAALLVAMIAIIVGVFVYDPPGASKIISSVANTLTK